MKKKQFITNLESLIDAYYNLTLDYGLSDREALFQLSSRATRKLIALLIQKLQLKL